MNRVFQRFSAFISVCVALSVALCAYAQKLDYKLSFDAEQHYINVELRLSEVPQDEVMLKMPVWAPGYYQIMDYPKHVSDFSVFDAEGKPLQWQKVEKNGWKLKTQDSCATVSYRVFAHERSVASSFVNSVMAFIAPNGVFMYIDGKKELPATISFVKPENWAHISTSLEKVTSPLASWRGVGGEAMCFYSPDFDTLYDSPMLLGNHLVKKINFEGHDYEFAIVGSDGFEESGFVEDFKQMVSATTRLMGDVPYKRYCVIHLGQGGGGLEHLSSQACYTSGSYRFTSRKEYLSHLSFVSHEYFHLYNVKSIRPIELGPFDYDREVWTPLLWVSEGFTCYYENKNLVSAGIVDVDFMLQDISKGVNYVENNEGHRHMSLRQSSYDIWLNFFNSADNHRDVTISYYDKGPVFGLLFDISISAATKGEKCLDDLMRLLYNRYYRELQRGFTEEEFWAAAAEVAGTPLTTLRRYVDTTDDIDYESILSLAGFRIDRNTWRISRSESMTKEQQKVYKGLGVMVK